MKSQIKIFETGLLDGVMSRNKKFYDENLTQEEINRIFKTTRISIGKRYGFNGLKIIQALQKNENNNLSYPDGKYIVIDEKNLQKEDLWYEELPADILIISNKYKNIVIGNQCADCPIVIAEDRKLGVTALAHCGAAYINRKLPYQIIEALKKEYNSNPENIYVYISSGAKKDSFIYETYPRWATNKDVWAGCIEENEDKYKIDMYTAIKKQLQSQKIKNIIINKKDTITDSTLASHYCAVKGQKEKIGQNFVGFYYN